MLMHVILPTSSWGGQAGGVEDTQLWKEAQVDGCSTDTAGAGAPAGPV